MTVTLRVLTGGQTEPHRSNQCRSYLCQHPVCLARRPARTICECPRPIAQTEDDGDRTCATCGRGLHQPASRQAA